MKKTHTAVLATATLAGTLAFTQTGAIPEDVLLRQAVAHLESQRAALGLDARTSFVHVKSTTDDLGYYHARYRQFFDGVRVQGGNAIVHMSAARVLSLTNRFFNSINIPTTPGISLDAAVAAARQQFDPGGRLRQVEVEDQELVIQPSIEVVDRGAPRAIGANEFYRRYEQRTTGYRLVWTVVLAATQGERQAIAYRVDAQTGAVISEAPFAQEENSVDLNGLSAWQGPVRFKGAYDPGTQRYFPRDLTRGNGGGNTFRNGMHRDTRLYTDSVTYYSPDDSFGNGVLDDGTADASSPAGETAAVDAAVAISYGWDMLRNVFGRNGMNGAGEQVDVRAHWGQGYKDAQFFPAKSESKRAIYLGDGSVSTSFSTVNHEMGHYWWSSHFGYQSYSNEFSGINEGHGDIMGALAEFYAWASKGQGSRIEDTDAVWIWRSRMVDPEDYQPSTRPTESGLRYYTPSIASFEVHNIGCLAGHWFIFVAHGASTDPNSTLSSTFLPNGMGGIGVHEAARIWYRTVTAFMPEDGTMLDLMDATVAAVSGPWQTGPALATVQAAWHGIGAATYGPVTGDKTPPTILSAAVTNINETGYTVEVEANVIDNAVVSRVEFRVGTDRAVVTRPPYRARLTLYGRPTGNNFADIEAFDVAGNSTKASRSFTRNGVKDLIVNGGFETSLTGWSSTVSYLGMANSYGGVMHWAPKGIGGLSQNFKIPADAKNPTLSYYVRVDNHQNLFRNQKLLVELRRPDNSLVRVIEEIGEEQDTVGEPVARTYIRRQFPIPEKNQDLALHFRWAGQFDDRVRFRIDNVALTYEPAISATVTATVRPADDSVEFTTVVTGLDASQIKEVSYWIDGTKNAGLGKTAPEYRRFYSLSQLPPGTHTVVAYVKKQDGTTWVQDSAAFTKPLLGEAIKNGGFEQNWAHWAYSPDVLIKVDSPDFSRAYEGIRYAEFGAIAGVQVAKTEQTVSLPLLGRNFRFSARVAVTTAEAGNVPADRLFVLFVDANNNAIPVGTVANNSAMGGAGFNNGYILLEKVLPDSVAGKTLRLQIVSDQNATLPTIFRVDNVHLKYSANAIQIP